MSRHAGPLGLRQRRQRGIDEGSRWVHRSQRADQVDGRPGRGQAEPHRLGRLRRGRVHRSEGRLGHAVREEDRLSDVVEDSQHLRRDGHAHADRPLRRRLGVGQRVREAHRRRRRGPDRHEAARELERPLAQRAVPGLQLGQQEDVRRPARLRRQPADVAHRQGQPGAHELGGRVRREQPVQGQGHRVRRPDLHRRRGAVPAEHQARPGDQEPLRARRQAVRRRGGPAQGTERAHRAVLV